jgi:hypothetical protein
LAIIPAGIDYWMNKRNTYSASGSAETATFPDRVNALQKLYEQLTHEVAELRPEVEILLEVSTGSSSTLPAISDGAETGELGFKTPHPSDFIDYGFPDCRPWPWRR